MLPCEEVVEIAMPSRVKGTCMEDMPTEPIRVAWGSVAQVATKTNEKMKMARPVLDGPQIVDKSAHDAGFVGLADVVSKNLRATDS